MGPTNNGLAVGGGAKKPHGPPCSEQKIEKKTKNPKQHQRLGGRKKSIVPSASSILLELLDRNAKERTAESRITSSVTAPSMSANNGVRSVAAAANSEKIGVSNPAAPAPGDASSSLGGNPHRGVPPSMPQQNPKSVVPQLMDIYDDLAQSSTPQTNVSLPPPLPNPTMPKGAYHPSSQHQSFDGASSQPLDRSGQRRISAAAAALSRSASARARRSKKVKANETEQPSRKKGKTCSTDQRWSKRFTWPDEASASFVCHESFASMILCSQNVFD